MIVLNNFRCKWQAIGIDALSTADEVGAGAWCILDQEVRKFEECLARYWSSGHGMSVASGLDTSEISLRVLGCKTGDRVPTSPTSAFAPLMAILRIGVIPMLIDCDEYGRSLPIHPFLFNDEISAVVDCCNSWRP